MKNPFWHRFPAKKRRFAEMTVFFLARRTTNDAQHIDPHPASKRRISDPADRGTMDKENQLPPGVSEDSVNRVSEPNLSMHRRSGARSPRSFFSSIAGLISWAWKVPIPSDASPVFWRRTVNFSRSLQTRTWPKERPPPRRQTDRQSVPGQLATRPPRSQAGSTAKPPVTICSNASITKVFKANLSLL